MHNIIKTKLIAMITNTKAANSITGEQMMTSNISSNFPILSTSFLHCLVIL